MSGRIAEIVVLCEDERHRSFINHYLAKLPVRTSKLSIVVCGGERYVKDRFPIELAKLRSVIAGRRRRGALLVLVDADTRDVAQRLAEYGAEPRIRDDESVAIVIPKRHIETWIVFLVQGTPVLETEKYKKAQPIPRNEVKRAAERLYDLTRPNAASIRDSPPSLVSAVLTLRRFELQLRAE